MSRFEVKVKDIGDIVWDTVVSQLSKGTIATPPGVLQAYDAIRASFLRLGVTGAQVGLFVNGRMYSKVNF